MFTKEECIEINGNHVYGDTPKTYGACVYCEHIHECDIDWNFELNEHDQWSCATCGQPCDAMTAEEIAEINEDFRQRDMDYRKAVMG